MVVKRKAKREISVVLRNNEGEVVSSQQGAISDNCNEEMAVVGGRERGGGRRVVVVEM